MKNFLKQPLIIFFIVYSTIGLAAVIGGLIRA